MNLGRYLLIVNKMNTKKQQSFGEVPRAGLSHHEAADRLKNEGFNELPFDRGRSLSSLFLGIFYEPMFILLISAGLVYLIIGDRSEAVTLLISMIGIIGITFYQEHKVERVLGALRNLTSPRAMVYREGNLIRIAGREVVRGDLIVLLEGDRVPADVILCSPGAVLLVDESLLTGESVPVRKTDDSPYLYSGSLIVQGRAFGEVKAIGTATKLGQIGKTLHTTITEKSPLQRETGRLIRIISFLGFLACGFVVLFYGISHGAWLEGVRRSYSSHGGSP